MKFRDVKFREVLAPERPGLDTQIQVSRYFLQRKYMLLLWTHIWKFSLGCILQNQGNCQKNPTHKLHREDYFIFKLQWGQSISSSVNQSNIGNLSSAFPVQKRREYKLINIFQKKDLATESQGERSLSVLPILHTEINDSLSWERGVEVTNIL